MNQATDPYNYSVVHLTAFEVVGDYGLRVTFSDGVAFDVDARRWFVRPDGELLGTPGEFAMVRLDEQSDTLLWPNDLFHLHGEGLYDRYFSERAHRV